MMRRIKTLNHPGGLPTSKAPGYGFAAGTTATWLLINK